jgi:ABC-type uncharacterized transport system substrate-binding protein
VRRRTFIVGVATAWPLTARAQSVPVIGNLNSASEREYVHLVAAFRKGLGDGGYTEGQNVTVDYRWANGQYDQLPALVAEMVSRRVAVIVAHGPPAAKAAKAATRTIPIVFTTGDDPVRLGLVSSMSRPGGNLTGVTHMASQILTKRVQMMHELLPQVSAMALLVNPKSTLADLDRQEGTAAARNLGITMHVLEASSDPSWSGPSEP